MSIEVVPRELLEALAALVPQAEAAGAGPAAAPPAGNGANGQPRLKVGEWLQARGREFRVKPQPDAKGRTVYVLKVCPFDAGHGDPDSCIMQEPGGKMAAMCFHNSCRGRGWQAFKAAIGPPDPEHYDPPLRSRSQAHGHHHHQPQAGRGTDPGKGEAPLPADIEADIHLTDLGNALRLKGRHGEDLRYCHPGKCWFTWDGRRWIEDQTGEIVRRVKETQKAFYREIADAILNLRGVTKDDDQRQAQLRPLFKLLKHATGWEDARAINRSIELARSELPVVPADLDRDLMLFNVLNGTLDLRTGLLRPHAQADMLTKLAPVVYDPEAKCPLWLKFLGRVMDGKDGLIGYLQRLVGYSLMGDVTEQSLWFFYGTGANGKSTFLSTVLAMLGDYGMQAVSDLLMVKRNESHSTERADLFGKRFVATIETEEGKRLAEALMKQMTGGDKIRARFLFKNHFEFSPTHKIVLAANHKPVIKGQDYANWRRIKLVPWTVTIPKDEKDLGLPDKLRAELPGILVWALQGLRDWQEAGMAEPAEVTEATAAYQVEQDQVQAFLSEECILNPAAKCKASALLTAYRDWSGDKFMTSVEFGKRLRAGGYASKRESAGVFWQGIGLWAAPAPTQPDDPE
jgi:putative DNA primase/helicase